MSGLNFKTQLKSYKRNPEKNILMILNKDGWHFLPVKELFPSLRGITSNDDKDFFFVWIISIGLEKKLESHERLCKSKDFDDVGMPLELKWT